jgi:hypothetical protein
MVKRLAIKGVYTHQTYPWMSSFVVCVGVRVGESGNDDRHDRFIHTTRSSTRPVQ